jgi:hypothetical protein
MPSLNFKKRFVQAIENGIDERAGRRRRHRGVESKTQTIRAERKQPIKKGDTLHLFVGLRTKGCRKLGVVECLGTAGVYLDQDGVRIDGRELSELECDAFAQRDGFKDFYDMVDFFSAEHGLPFEGGSLIQW